MKRMQTTPHAFEINFSHYEGNYRDETLANNVAYIYEIKSRLIMKKEYIYYYYDY